jgi:aminomethyltransferase
MNRTRLYQCHADAGAKFIDFSTWEMPIHYGSQIEEHLAVRSGSGVFDVSHMQVVDIVGSEAKEFLRLLLANDVAKLTIPGKALYSCLLNAAGCVLDDLIVYWLAPDHYRLVVNCATAASDIDWIQQQAKGFAITILPKPEFAIVAIQGPDARNKTHAALTSLLNNEQLASLSQLKKFFALNTSTCMIARTGYTGEDGYEVIIAQDSVVTLWQQLLKQGVRPCGLGARDTLRLEAGLNLYGQDMDTSVTPWESNLGWTVNLEDPSRNFIGRDTLIRQKELGITHKLVGVVLTDKGVLRPHQKVIVPQIGDGILTSGSYSPTLKCSIGLARVPTQALGYCQIVIRDKLLDAKVVSLPFVRNGVSNFS